jgi:DNA-binding MarR family transcriptional regulator
VGLPFDPIAEAERQWDAHFSGAPLAPMAAVTSVMRAHQLLLARLNELLEPWDITFPRYEALMLLYFSRAGALPLGKMGDRLQVHRASVTNVIDRLADAGLVERVQPPEDRRTVLAAITDRGRQVAREATERLHEERFATAPLDDEQSRGLVELLTPLREDAGDFSGKETR